MQAQWMGTDYTIVAKVMIEFFSDKNQHDTLIRFARY